MRSSPIDNEVSRRRGVSPESAAALGRTCPWRFEIRPKLIGELPGFGREPSPVRMPGMESTSVVRWSLRTRFMHQRESRRQLGVGLGEPQIAEFDFDRRERLGCHRLLAAVTGMDQRIATKALRACEGNRGSGGARVDVLL